METANKGIHRPIARQLRAFRLDEALASLERMPNPPCLENLTCILLKCRKHKDPANALRLHAYLRKNGLEVHKSLGNYLVPVLVEAGCMCDAQQVFGRLVDRNEYSWTSLITGCVECGELEHAFLLYQKMREDCVHPNGYTFVALLKACTRLKDTKRGKELHSEIARKGLLEADPFVANTLVDMYAKCGLLAKAQEVFDECPVRNTVCWNTLIAGYAEHDLGRDALNYLEQMQLEGFPPNSITCVCSLKACGSIGAIDKGQEIHAMIVRNGLVERDPFIGNILVDMYARCGLLAKAQVVFDKLPIRDAVSWTALIQGYAEHELGQDALNCFEQMQLEGVPPNAVTFVCCLKACGSISALGKCREIHAQIARKGWLETNPFVGNTLVDTYAKCGLLAKAQEVFHKLPIRDAVSWNALVAGYVELDLGQDALTCFEQMQLEGISPDSVTFICSLKACGSIEAIDKGRELHAEVVRKGLLERHSFVGNTLVDMYVNCGLLAKAQELFDKLPVLDAVSWTALIAGYAEHEHGQDALNCFEQMQLEGVSPDSVTFVCCLRACGSIGAIDKGRELHAQIARKGLLESDPFVGNALVVMYTKCGLLAKAKEVLDKLPVRDVVSWNSLIAGYAEHGLGQDVLKCFEQMQLEGVSPDSVTFVCSLRACGSIGAIDKGREIHAQIAKNGLLERGPLVGNTLVDMYGKCGLLAKAHVLFDKLPVRNAVSWTALIAGFGEHDLGQDALNCFEQMQLEGISPDSVTFVCSLRACSSIGAIDKGQEIHAQISKKGLLESDPFLGNTLVDMYAKCGLLAKAQEVFSKLPVQNAVSWTALIAGYAEHGLGQDALNCFEQMQLEGVSPDSVTFVCSLRACRNIGAIDKGWEIHAQISKKGLLESDPFVGNTLVDLYGKCGLLAKAQEVFDKLQVRDATSWNSLVDMYAKCGLLAKAQTLFDKLPVRDAFSWNALIVGYAEHDLGQDTLNCLEQMQLEGVPPDAVTFVCSLKACSSLGAMDKGQEIHGQIARNGLLKSDPFLGSSLVAMYAKFGLLAKAQEVFDKLSVRDAVSWNALIAGYAQLGESENVFLMLYRMKAEDIKPDGVTCLCILTVCSHTGLVEKGHRYFEAMSKDYGITPTIEHYNCMVDILGRAGQLDKAVVMIDKMPFNPDLVLWHTVLGACQKWGNVDLGRWAFEHAVELDKRDAVAHVLMSNIYADDHAEEDARQVELMISKEQAWKELGQNWTDAGGIVHSFLEWDTRHPQSNYKYAKLDPFFNLKEEKYVPVLHWLSQDVCDDLKEWHGENWLLCVP